MDNKEDPHPLTPIPEDKRIEVPKLHAASTALLKELLSQLYDRTSRIKRFAVPLSILFAASLFVLEPWLTRTQYVEVLPSQGRVDLQVPAGIADVTLSLSTPTVLSSFSFTYAGPVGVLQPVTNIPVGRSLEVIELHRPPPPESSGFVERTRFMLVFPPHVRRVTIASVALDGRTVPLRQALQLFSSTPVSYRDRRMIREAVASVLTEYNESASNWIMTIMAASWALMNVYLVTAFVRNARAFGKRSGQESAHPSRVDQALILDTLDSIFASRLRWWSLAQSVGPALGFLMTISSLVVAFHAGDGDTARDLGEFFGSVQVALISTFIGLLLRVWAIWLERMDMTYLLWAAENDQVSESLTESTAHA